MWIAYPLYADTYTGENKFSGTWAAAQGISDSYQINVWDNSYNVYLGNTMYSDPFSTSGNEYYARGHQIPDADRQYNKDMVQQTYYAINSTPQIQNGFNGGIWQQLEQAVRTQASSDTLYVATGPLFYRKDITDTTEPVMITPRGDPTKTCPVPKYYWKVLLKVKRNNSGDVESASSIGFFFVHQEYSNSSYGDYAVRVNEIESRTGLDLFANLPDSIEESVEANDNWQTFQTFQSL
jgi:endonuclease G